MRTQDPDCPLSPRELEVLARVVVVPSRFSRHYFVGFPLPCVPTLQDELDASAVHQLAVAAQRKPFIGFSKNIWSLNSVVIAYTITEFSDQPAETRLSQRWWFRAAN
jgi:hypothetical protein